MTPSSTPIEDSTVEQVANFVRDGIIQGDFPPGSKLLPKQIAEQCGTSFIPVREALRALESEGFVNFVHNRGAWVTQLSKADLLDIYTLRIELECEAVRRAAPFTDGDISELNEILGRLSERHGQHDRAGVVALNREFHFSIYRKADSPRRLKLIDQLWLHSSRYQRLVLDHRDDGADAEHRKMVAKLRQGDHEGAAQALRAHLGSTVDLMSADIDDIDDATNASGDDDGSDLLRAEPPPASRRSRML